MLELHLRTMVVDSHSSVPSLLPNAGQRLSRRWRRCGTPTAGPPSTGLDAGVVPPTDAQLAVVASYDLRDLDDMRKDQGIERFIAGSTGSPQPRR